MPKLKKTKILQSSMTGFSSKTYAKKGLSLYIEIKSLNSRYLDFNIKSPNLYNHLDLQFRKKIQSIFNRGRFDILIERKLESFIPNLKLNRKLFIDYWSIFKDLSESVKEPDIFNDKTQITNFILTNFPIIEEERSITKYEEKIIIKLFNEVTNDLLKSRHKEAIKTLSNIRKCINEVKKIYKSINNSKRLYLKILEIKLKERISLYISDNKLLDDKIAQELSYLVSKSDVNEELSRIASHLKEIEALLSEQLIGKKLEFFCQELTREFNTISSKVQDATLQKFVVLAKLEIEKIKEQSFNLE